MEHVRYLVKLLAAVVMGGFGAILLIASLFDKMNWIVIAFGAVTLAGGWLSWPRRPHAWKNDPPTDRQLAFAADLGIDIPPGATKGEVSALISAVTGR